MSYDIYRQPQVPENISCDLNITYNLAKMFSWAFSVDDWKIEVNNKLGSHVEIKTRIALRKLRNNRVKACTYSPSNNWGTYEQAIYFLELLKEQAQIYPTDIFIIN